MTNNKTLAIIVAANLIFGMNTYAGSNEVKLSPKHVSIIKAIKHAAKIAEVPENLLLAVCWKESSFNRTPKLTHMDGGSLSYDICQIKLATANWMDDLYKHKVRATDKSLRDPFTNAFYAAKYIKYQLKLYNDIRLAADAYNRGSEPSTDSDYANNVVKYKAFFESQTIGKK